MQAHVFVLLTASVTACGGTVAVEAGLGDALATRTAVSALPQSTIDYGNFPTDAFLPLPAQTPLGLPDLPEAGPFRKRDV
jgi:hypothetical protein